MALYLFYILLGIYGIALLISMGYYLSRRAPSGDASVGWAIGFFYMIGLGAILILAWLLRRNPVIGLLVLSFPLLFLAWPRLRQTWTDLKTRIPVMAETPPLTLFIENNTISALHIRIECWFGSAKSHSARLYTTFDYFVDPKERSNYLLSNYQTRLLAHKSKYVSIQVFERVTAEYEGHTYIKEIQPCMQHYDEKIEAFRKEKYTIAIQPGML